MINKIHQQEKNKTQRKMENLDHTFEVFLQRLYPLLGTKLGFFSPFFIATNLILAKAFRNGYIVACRSARRSATAKQEMDAYGTVPQLSKNTQHCSTADYIKF